MISKHYYKNIRIDITTYTKNKHTTMNHHESHPKYIPSRFICSVCLNKKPKSDEFVNSAKVCPICTNFNVGGSDDEKKENNLKTKYVQTSETDRTHGISLLNEVLNVFQSKKKLSTDSNKTILKDASVNTNKKQLVMSEIFHYSIEDDTSINTEGRFTIINNYDPQNIATIALSKHKSSSIPQMKLEELKHSLKEKTKSKDAIEEVNRMFANVRKVDVDKDSNRPLIRNGPRVLPVVKTATYAGDACRKYKSQCCQEFQMSSGDSGLNGCKIEKCAECLYMCCHYQRYKCENCHKFKPDHGHCRK